MNNMAYVGLGSNLDDPSQHIYQAFTHLDYEIHSQVTKVSSLYRSQPIGPQDQDDFINAAAAIRTTLDAQTFLNFLQSIETKHQRKRTRHWGPRTLDLDLLLFNQDTINLPDLKVPHPYLTQRDFVLYPLVEIAPELCLPNQQLLREFTDAKSAISAYKIPNSRQLLKRE